MNEVQQAVQRVKNCLGDLPIRYRQGLMLAEIASMMITANELYSALSVIYDSLYDQNETLGIINRKPTRPFPRRKRFEKLNGGAA